jgi:hypothetical protein
MVAFVSNLLVPKTIDIGATADGRKFPSNPAVHGMAEATLSYVKYLYALAIA